MEFKSIKKVHEGEFLSRYDISYMTVDNKEKIYEMVSRDKNLQSKEDIQGGKPDSIVLIMHSRDKEKILINKEYRLSVSDWVCNFPAGLIDEGETGIEAAKRELKEETGLDLIEITQELPITYSAVGFSNEKNYCYIGIAEGNIRPSDSTLEEIEAKWYTKKEIRDLLKKERFSARAQAYCYLWSKED